MGGTCHCIKHPHMIGLFLGLPWFATCMCLFVVKILVLTCFFLKLLVLTCFSQTCAQVKKRGTLTSFGVDMFFSQTFGVDMCFSNSCKSKNWET